MQSPIYKKLCKYNINGQCSKLFVKCLEIRWFGGVQHGKCRIREGEAYCTLPKPTRPKNFPNKSKAPSYPPARTLQP